VSLTNAAEQQIRLFLAQAVLSPAVRKALEECRSPDAGLAIAMVDWFMGKPGALDKFRAIRSRAEGLTEEE
jgi:hypothetical protein